jgi:hypothetical protein
VVELLPHLVNDIAYELPLAVRHLNIQSIALLVQDSFNNMEEKDVMSFWSAIMMIQLMN